MRLRLYRYAADRQIAYKPKMMFALRECKREASALDKVRIDRNASAISMWLRSFSESRQIAQMIIASKPTPMRFNRSFYSVSREMGGYPIKNRSSNGNGDANHAICHEQPAARDACPRKHSSAPPFCVRLR